MKKLIFILGVLPILWLASCTQSSNDSDTLTIETVDSNAVTKIEFEKTDVDLGTIIQGEIVEYVFKFKNVGDDELQLKHVKASCGCTTPNFSKEIIKPGESGEVLVKFNSTGRSGKQSKSVKVYANTEPSETVLHFVAEVEVKQ